MSGSLSFSRAIPPVNRVGLLYTFRAANNYGCIPLFSDFGIPQSNAFILQKTYHIPIWVSQFNRFGFPPSRMFFLRISHYPAIWFSPISYVFFLTSYNLPILISNVFLKISHHPPISAFYMTNRHDGFSLSGSILARSKFYGNSLSAILDGVARLAFLKRGEEYDITTPYAHCKGMLQTKSETILKSGKALMLFNCITSWVDSSFHSSYLPILLPTFQLDMSE